MLDKRSAAVALVAVIAAVLPAAQALTYGELAGLYPDLYGKYFPTYYGQYGPLLNTSVTPNTTNAIIGQLQRALSGSMPSFGLAPLATALLVILAVAQLFV